MRENPVLEKSFAFALRIVNLYRFLCAEKSEYVTSRAALVAGTNVGRHAREAVFGESRQAFVTEMAVALKKASETAYWLELLHAAGYLDEKSFVSIGDDCLELIKMLTSIVKTAKRGSDL